LTICGQGTPPNSPKFPGIRADFILTDIQVFLDSEDVVVETLFSGLLRLREAKLNSVQNELGYIYLNKYCQHNFAD